MCTAGAKNKSRDQSSYAALMAEYRNRMGMDKSSRTSSLKMAENPSVGVSNLTVLPMLDAVVFPLDQCLAEAPEVCLIYLETEKNGPLTSLSTCRPA
jgi:hypothetical protein